MYGSPWDRVEIKARPRIPSIPGTPGGYSGPTRPRPLKPAAFDPDSVDADLDGWRQEGTTARWYGLSTKNPIYKVVQKAFEKITDPEGSTDWLPAGFTEVEHWVSTANRFDTRTMKAPPLEVATLETDLSLAAGYIDLLVKKQGDANIGYASRRAAAWVKAREIQRSRQGAAGRLLAGDEDSALQRVEKQIEELKKKRIERDKRISELTELTEEVKKAARSFDLSQYADKPEEFDDDEWFTNWDAENPEPVPGDFMSTEQFYEAHEDWDIRRDQEYEDARASFVPNEELIDKLNEIFDFTFTTEQGNTYFVQVDYADDVDYTQMALHFSITTVGDRADGVPDGTEIGNAKRHVDLQQGILHNEILRIDEDFRGEQISTIMAGRNEQIFALMGIDMIEVDAASSSTMNGATHWPKVGFDWDNPGERDYFISVIQDALDRFASEYDPDGPPPAPGQVPLFASLEEAASVAALLDKARTQDFDDPNRITAGDLVNWTGSESWFKSRGVIVKLIKPIGQPPQGGQVKWLIIDQEVKAVNKPNKPNLPNLPNKPTVGGGGPSKPRMLKPAVFDPTSVDVDNDGWHQEGTTAAWFGAGLNNPVVQSLRDAMENLDDDQSSNASAWARQLTWGRYEGAPRPEDSTLEADLAWLGGKILLAKQEEMEWEKGSRMTPPPPTSITSQDGQWLLGREEIRKGSSVRSEVFPESVVQLSDEDAVELLDRVATQRKERRVVADAKMRVKSEDSLTDEARTGAKNFNFDDHPADENVEILGWQEYLATRTDAPPRNTDFPLNGTPEEWETYQREMDTYYEWSDRAYADFMEYERKQKNLKAEKLSREIKPIFEFEFSGNNGKKYSTRVDTVHYGDLGASFIIDGVFLDENGNEVGVFQREFFPETGVVNHSHLKLNSSERGSQVSGIFNSRNEIIYRDMGYHTISVSAASGGDYNGASHWPKMGFDWADEDEREAVLLTVEDALTRFAVAIKDDPDSLPVVTKSIKGPDGETESVVEIPIFSSREEAESLAQLVEIARTQDFDDPDRLTAGDFVNWSGAEEVFKEASLSSELTRPVGGTGPDADVTPETPDVETPGVDADAPKRSMSPEEIKQKNEQIFTALDSVGGRFGGMDEEYKSLEANDGIPPITTFTKEELTGYRIQNQKDLFKALRRYFETGERPQGTYVNGKYVYVGDDDYEPSALEPYDLLRGFTDKQLEQISPELRQVIMESSDEELDERIQRAAVAFHEDIDRSQISVQIPVNRIDSVLDDGSYKTTHEVHSNHSDSGTRVRIEAERMGIPRNAPTETRPSSGYIVLGEHVEAATAAWEEVTPSRVDDDRFQEKFSSKNYTREFAASGVDGIYGDIRVVLKPEVAERTAYSYGDTIQDGPMGVTLLTETDPEVITNTLTRVGQQASPQHQILKLLNAEVTGSSIGVGESRFDGRPDLADRRLAEDLAGRPLAETVEQTITSRYFESTTLGGFDLGEVSQVYLPPKARRVDINNLTPETRDAVISEFLSTDVLRARGLSEEEIAYVQDALRRGRISNVDGYSSIERILEFRRAKELDQRFSEYGIEVIHQHPMSLDIMDPRSYGGETGDDVEELMTRKGLDALYKSIQDGYKREMERRAAPKVEAPTGLDVGAIG